MIAHRGASAELPEHTLAAYVRALELGADGLECDVRLTRDGHLVCIHDRTVDRTSDGSGVVSTMTLAELQRLDFGSWFDGEPASVLTLRRCSSSCDDAGRPMRLLIETKHPTRRVGQVEAQLIHRCALQRTGAATHESPITVMSFAESALRRVNKLAPALSTVLLREHLWGPRRAGVLPDGIAIAGPDMALVRSDPAYVERAHALGNQVYVWTVEASRT